MRRIALAAIAAVLFGFAAQAQVGPAPSSGSGLNQLTGAVTAGPGTGSQPATIPAGQAGTINTGCQATGGTALLPATVTISTKITDLPIAGATYTVGTNSECGGATDLNNTSTSTAVTIPAAGSGIFTAGWSETYHVPSTGVTATFTPASGTINGSASVQLKAATSGLLRTDGSNYFMEYLGSGAAPGGSSGQLQTNNGSGGFSGVAAPAGTVVGTSDSQTLTNKSIAASEVNSGTLAAGQMPALTGDCTTVAGAVATTCTLSQGNPLGLITVNVGTVNFNSANTDTSFTVPTTPNAAYALADVIVYGCTAANTSATYSLFTAASAGGFNLINTTTGLNSATGPAAASSMTRVNGTLSGGGGVWMSQSTLFFRVIAAQGTAVTCKVSAQLYQL